VNGWVLDASVAAKWILPPDDESFTDQAVAILDQYRHQEVELSVPDLFWPELSSLLLKAVRRERIPFADAETGLEKVLTLEIPTMPSETLVAKAFQIARVENRSVYDSVYVAMAIAARSTLITADERLANGLGGRFPVRWIGAI
jgi:predicted nucleic acid-binding protein